MISGRVPLKAGTDLNKKPSVRTEGLDYAGKKVPGIARVDNVPTTLPGKCFKTKKQE